MTELPNIDAPRATLYRTAISLGTSEIQVIWTRYTGFIVINGFLISALAQQWAPKAAGQAPPVNTVVLALVGASGLILNSVWHILNFSGWQNQNLFYYQAHKLLGQPIGLVTDQFDRRRLPYGWIYWIAQLTPTIFSLGASGCFGGVLTRSWGLAWCVATIWSAVLWLALAVCVVIIEYCFIWPWTQKRGGEGEAV